LKRGHTHVKGDGRYNTLQRRSGVDFTDILRAAFMHADPKSAKRQCTDGLIVFFALLEYTSVKAARKSR